MSETTLKFAAKKSVGKDGNEIKDRLGEIVYESNDIAVLEELLQLVDTNIIGKKKWLTVLSIEDKVRERYRAEAFDCEIEFSPKEYVFLQELFENIEDKMRKGQRGEKITLTLYHLRTWRALSVQLDEKEKEEEPIKDNKKEEEDAKD